MLWDQLILLVAIDIANKLSFGCTLNVGRSQIMQSMAQDNVGLLLLVLETSIILSLALSRSKYFSVYLNVFLLS
ncbi:hypothetical protein ACE6H2_026889 [Prunus campanulata]